MKFIKNLITILIVVFVVPTVQSNSLDTLIPDDKATHIAVNNGSWFLASTWNTNSIPTAASIVLIPADKEVSYAGNSEEHIFAVKVKGKLVFTQTNSSSLTKLVVDTFVGTMSSKIYFHASNVTDGKIDIVFKPFDIEKHKNDVERIHPLTWNSDIKNYFQDGLDHYKVTYKITTTDSKDRFEDAADGNANTSLSQYSSVLVNDGPGVYGRSSWDSGQLSLGLVTMGQIQILGYEKTTKLKLASNAAKGQNNLSLVSNPVGWNSGDKLVINSGGNQLTSSKGIDERNIASIAGSTVTTTSNLSFNHDGRAAESLHCYVGNLSRNIRFYSADVSEISRRGHFMVMHNAADVQIKYAQFKDLGRTDKSRLADDFIYDKWLDPVVFTSKLSALGQECMQLKNPDVNKITNSRGRYSIHLHRTGATIGSKAAVVKGNVVWGNPGWGITHHDSHAEIVDNIVFDVTGAGIVSEAGNETGFWDDNFVLKILKARTGTGDAFTPVTGENYFDPDFYHSALFYDDYLFRGEGLAMRGRAIVCRNNIISDANFGVGVTNINPVKTNLERVDPAALVVLRPNHLVDHFPLDMNGWSKEGNGVMPVEVALLFENTEIVNSYTGLNSIERDMAVNHESRSVFEGIKCWGTNIGLQLTYQADYSFKDVYISGKNMNSRAIDLWKHSSNHSFENIKIEDCATAMRVSKVVGLGTNYLNLKTRNNGFTQWTFVNYSENNVTDHYELELDSDGATYTYNEHSDNIVYMETADKIDREIAFTITEDTSDLEVDVANEDFRFSIDGYISDSAGSYNYGVKSPWAQGNLRYDYPERIYEFASKEMFEDYLSTKNVYKDASNGDQLYFIINEVVPDRLTFEYKSFPIRIHIKNPPYGAPYDNAIYESDMDLLPQTEILSLNATTTQSSTNLSKLFEGVTIETPASRAIDGNTNGRLHAQFYQQGLVDVGSSSYTNEEFEPWWDLDLGENRDIESIDVWGTQSLSGKNKPNAQTSFDNIYILFSETPFGPSSLSEARAMSIKEYFRGSTGSRLFSKTHIETRARYVRIQGIGTRELGLAEVSVNGKKMGPKYCDLLEESGIVVNGDFECGFDSNWELDVSGNAIATYSDGTSESFEGNTSAGITVSNGDAYNKVVLKNIVYKGILKDKTITISCQAKAASATDESFRFQISIKNDLGITTNKTSPVMYLTDTYQKFEYNINLDDVTQEVLVKINLGKTAGNYYFDNIESLVEDSLALDELNEKENNFSFYPNPARNFILIKNIEIIDKVDVFNLYGQYIKSMRIDSKKLDISLLKKGVYIIIANLKNGNKVNKKLIITH
ncbi:T9SS type A sorting domain-containing protein [Bacteroidota bacterium]